MKKINIKDFINFWKQYNNFCDLIHKKENISLRDIDKALFEFGQFLVNPQIKLEIK